jgi:signal transduction histidine kinase/ActR/RegA family two-component response regulator
VPTSNSQNGRSRLGGEVVSLAAVVLGAFVFRAAIDPFIGDTHQYLPAYAAVGTATWFFGWRAGVIVAAACLLSDEVFGPISSSDRILQHQVLAHAAYAGVSAAVISLSEWRRRECGAAANAAARLREADLRTSEFLALLGHELRNPLASIAMGGKMLAGGLDPAAARLTLRMVERQTEHMTRLVDELADIGSLQKRKLSLQREIVDVFAAVQEATVAVRAATDAKQQKVVLSRPENVGEVYAHMARLQQMLVHLLHNASRFSPERTTIAVSLRASEHCVSVSVEDAGVGIPPSELPRIFEPFMQLGHSAGPTRGLGLGLAITRELADLHGGTVRAFSAGIGRGSEFVLSLPRGLPADTPPRFATRADAVQTGVARSRVRHHSAVARQRILIVDDNADAAASLALLLKLKGHEAMIALDGRAALEIAGRKRPHLVFLETGLRDMNGLDVAMTLRDVLGPDPALVAVTGWGSEDDQARSRAAGLDAHLTKPVDLAAIDQVLTLLGCAGEPSRA